MPSPGIGQSDREFTQHFLAIGELSYENSIAKESPFTEDIGQDLIQYLEYHGLGVFRGISSFTASPIDVFFWNDVVLLISEYEDVRRLNLYFWQEEDQ